MGKAHQSLTGLVRDYSIFIDEEGRKALAILRERGTCQDYPLEIFFPSKGESARPAKAVCSTCPVQAPCLAFALEHFEREGIWGQTNERDRRPLIRRMRAGESPHDIAAEYHSEATPRQQCIAMSKRTGKRCSFLAGRNSEVCGRHGHWASRTAAGAA